MLQLRNEARVDGAGLEGGLGVVDVDTVAEVVEVAGGDEAVAAVVAGAGEDDDAGGGGGEGVGLGGG